MIECKIFHDGEEIGRLTFHKVFQDNERNIADYSVEVGVERLGTEGSVGLSTVRVTEHPIYEANALALIRSALNKLFADSLKLDPGTTRAQMMKRSRSYPAVLSRLRRAVDDMTKEGGIGHS